MDLKKLYLFYGLVIGFLGILGFLLTQAKSALISGLISASLLIVVSFFANGQIGNFLAKFINILLLGTFTWRTVLAITALTNDHPEKLIPSILLSLMALVSVVVAAISFLTKETVSKDRL